MKVKELIEHLSKLPQDVEVLTASDDEGNSYNTLYYAPGLFHGQYTKYGWEIKNDTDLKDDLKAGYAKLEDFQPVVVI